MICKPVSTICVRAAVNKCASRQSFRFSNHDVALWGPSGDTWDGSNDRVADKLKVQMAYSLEIVFPYASGFFGLLHKKFLYAILSRYTTVETFYCRKV